jgi:2-polyprenyl-3-methyl-5-hydroxy-6-metoxy-1,4-benzoquinol methylase
MDRARIDDFFDRFVGHLAGASALGMLAVADRSGLLAWLGEHGGGTAGDIARDAGMEERYVVEILSGLAAAGVLEHDDGVFSLPPEHALFVADGTSPYYMGGWLDMLPAGFAVIDEVARAVRQGGGVGFEEYGEDLLRGLDRANAPSQSVLLTRKWLPAVPGLVERLESGIDVADIGCGAGTAVITMARAYPASRFWGFDLSQALLDTATERAQSLENVWFGRTSADQIPTEPGFDLVTAFDVVHDLADPASTLQRVRSALRPDGVFLMVEPNMSSDLDQNLHEIGVINYGISLLHCMTQSLAAGGAGLGAAWGRERAEAMALESGFSTFEPLEDIMNRFSAFYVLRP